jgi:hypothetical protein
MRLGIVHERIDPGHPEQNGQHERMHRTLKAETTRPAGQHSLEQQERFDAFREECNNERPHEALDGKAPAKAYTPSPRPFPEKLADPVYPLHDDTPSWCWTWAPTTRSWASSSQLRRDHPELIAFRTRGGALNIQKKCYPCARSKTSPIFPLAHKTPTNSLTPTRPATRGPALRAARNYPTDSSYGNLCDLTALADHPGLRFPRICAEVVPVMWAVAIRLDPNRIRMGRDALIARLLADGIETRPGFYPASAQPPFAGPPVGNSERLASQIISLPASPTLAEEEVDQVCTRLLALASP